MLKFKKLTTMILASVTITACTVSLNSVQALAETKANAGEKLELKVYNSTVGSEDSEQHMKFITNAKFFEDPYTDKRTVFLSTDGSFINSALSQDGSYYYGEMQWPSAYECSINISDENNSGGETQIVSSTPTNAIKTSKVSNTVGYALGGNIAVSAEKLPTATLTSNFNCSQNISYDQENYATVQNVNSLHKTNWKVDFQSTPDGYQRDSFAAAYGNQMFMRSRTHYTGKENLTTPDKLPALISGGFSPNYLVALKAPKNKKETIVDITFKRHLDLYELKWVEFKWSGFNKENKTNEVTKRFVINWNKHTLKTIEEYNKEKETREIKEIVKKLNNEYNEVMNKPAETEEQKAFKEKVEKLILAKKINWESIVDDSKTEVIDGIKIVGKKTIWKFVN